MNWGAAFDAGRIHTAHFDIRQLAFTQHDRYLERDYKVLREEWGFSVFRDGVDLQALARGDWSYLDRLANIANGQVWLSLYHYDVPNVSASNFLSKRAQADAVILASEISMRYKGVFPVYFPVVELGYWASMIGTHKVWWPATDGVQGGWWDFYRVLAKMAVSVARIIRANDPSVKIAMSEPWLWSHETPTADLVRPFRTMLGVPDEVMQRELGCPTLHGSSDLLQIAGLNCYGMPSSTLLKLAAGMLPGVEIILAETGTSHHPAISIRQWMEDTQNAVRQSEVNVEVAFWAPAVQIASFDTGLPAPGSLLTR